MPLSQRAQSRSAASIPNNAPAARTASPYAKWFRGVGRWFGSKSDAKPSQVKVDPLLEFPAESSAQAEPAPQQLPAAPAAPASRERWTPVRGMILATAIALAIIVALLQLRGGFVLQGSAAEPRPGRLAIDTRPGHLEILLDGVHRGTSPLMLSVMPGAHTVIIRNGSAERVVPVTIAAGTDVTQYFEMSAVEPLLASGRLSVVTDPPGARVFVDGVARGISPVIVDELQAAEHRVSVTTDNGPMERTVSVAAGGTASVVFSLSKSSTLAGPVGGWLAVEAPFDVEIVEHEDLVGTSGARRIMIAAGRHDVVLANRTLGYRDARTIDVTAGKTTTLKIDPPKVPVSLNARPWADVMLDGAGVGQTPIANVLVAIGSHEVVFRHPQLAELRQTVVVTANGPNRIAADLTK
jgi:PEGA domain-containing protein